MRPLSGAYEQAGGNLNSVPLKHVFPKQKCLTAMRHFQRRGRDLNSVPFGDIIPSIGARSPKTKTPHEVRDVSSGEGGI